MCLNLFLGPYSLDIVSLLTNVYDKGIYMPAYSSPPRFSPSPVSCVVTLSVYLNGRQSLESYVKHCFIKKRGRLAG